MIKTKRGMTKKQWLCLAITLAATLTAPPLLGLIAFAAVIPLWLFTTYLCLKGMPKEDKEDIN